MTLKGFTNVFSSTITNDIQDSLIEYFDWSLLEKGNYFNVSLGETIDGNDYSILKISNNANYAPGAAWESFRKNWVWQSGVNYSPSPVVGFDVSKPGVSGVYVNDIFYSSDTSGQYSHYIDYYHGRVIFNSPIPTGSKVQVEHSYKWINVDYSNSVPWLREIQQNTLTPGDFLKNKDLWNLPPESRIQLPIIAIEMVPTRSFEGYQLGGGQWIRTDVLFHCIAEDDITRNKLIDIVSLQNDGTINLFNSNLIYQNNDFPLDYRGCPVSGAKRYPDLINLYNGGRCRLINGNVSKMEALNSNVYGGIVRFTVEGIKLNI
jgi:hypothetical protein